MAFNGHIHGPVTAAEVADVLVDLSPERLPGT
jgi:hypothetical protein